MRRVFVVMTAVIALSANLAFAQAPRSTAERMAAAAPSKTQDAAMRELHETMAAIEARADAAAGKMAADAAALELKLSDIDLAFVSGGALAGWSGALRHAERKAAMAQDLLSRAAPALAGLDGKLDAAAAAFDASAVSPLPLLAQADRAATGREREQEARDRADEAKERAQEAKERDGAARDRLVEAYDRGTEALDEQRWQRALEAFDSASRKGSPRADGALYWKAYTLNKLGRRQDALATLRALETGFPKSRWLNDARALEIEVRQGAGQPVSAQAQGGDDEQVLLALNAMQNTDPDRALPILEKFLNSSRPPRQKERALFVLVQMHSPKARDLVAQIARGQANPDLQMRAINYLGVFGGRENADRLASIYQASADPDVKRAVLRSFMISGQKDRVLAAAKTEQNPVVREEAIRQLGVMGGQAELWQLYGSETTVEGKERILKSMFVGGNSDKLAEVARTEKDPRLRRAAIRSLGIMGTRGGDVLTTLYATEQDPEVKREIIRGLFIQQNAKALVDIARKEQNPELKKDVVRQLSVMHSKEATDYMLDILNK